MTTRHAGLCLAASALALLTPLAPLYPQQEMPVSLAVGANYARAFGGGGVSAALDFQMVAPLKLLGARPGLGLRAQIATLELSQGRPPVELVAVGARMLVRWQVSARVRPHLSVPIEIVRWRYTGIQLLCRVPMGGTSCLPTSGSGLTLGVEGGVHIRLIGGFESRVNASTQWGKFRLPDGDVLLRVEVGLTYRWRF